MHWFTNSCFRGCSNSSEKETEMCICLLCIEQYDCTFNVWLFSHRSIEEIVIYNNLLALSIVCVKYMYIEFYKQGDDLNDRGRCDLKLHRPRLSNLRLESYFLTHCEPNHLIDHTLIQMYMYYLLVALLNDCSGKYASTKHWHLLLLCSVSIHLRNIITVLQKASPYYDFITYERRSLHISH